MAKKTPETKFLEAKALFEEKEREYEDMGAELSKLEENMNLLAEEYYESLFGRLFIKGESVYRVSNADGRYLDAHDQSGGYGEFPIKDIEFISTAEAKKKIIEIAFENMS